MSQSVDSQLSEIPPSATKDQMELLKFLREEAEASRKAQREESDANRKLFLDTSKIVAIPLAVLLTLAGIFFYHDVNTMKEAMKAQGEASARLEIQKMDKHIDDTLQAQFKSETIQSTIQQAAVVATREQAPGLIKEVITPEVKRAVANQSGAIKEVAAQAATDEVKSAINPVVADVKLQAVVARANADEAQAFDELLELRSTGSPSQKDLVNGVIVNLERHATDGASADMTSNYDGCANPSRTDYQARLFSAPIVAIRKNAIAECIAYMRMGQWVPEVSKESVSAFTVVETIAPMWIKVAYGDSSLSVRAEAITGINWLFKGGLGIRVNSFDLLDTTSLRLWWVKNSSNQATLALLAFAYGGPLVQQGNGRIDEIGLYDEAERLAKISPQPLAPELEQLRERMRSLAADGIPPPSDLERQMGRDCTGVQQDFGVRLQAYRVRPEDERVDGFGLLEMQYLETACSVKSQLLYQIAEYGVSTRSLSRRYAAVAIVNKASGVSLDPYDPKPLDEWLKTHNDKPDR